jgi:hypothetical protein
MIMDNDILPKVGVPVPDICLVSGIDLLSESTMYCALRYEFSLSAVIDFVFVNLM